MRFAEFFRNPSGPVISIEVFPPKTEKAVENLDRALPRLVALEPSYFTVTYGAFGSTQARSLDIAATVRQKFGVVTASHLTCVGSTKEEIDEILERLSGHGIENIVALRGDPPQGEKEFQPPPGGFRHANELVSHLRDTARFGVAVAGYPEKHVEAPDLDTDLRYLKQKVDAGADVIITQLFYRNEDFFHFRDKARALGVAVPIIPGLLPIQSLHQILRITSMCGASVPQELHDELEAAGDDQDRLRDIGIRWTIEQARGLLEAGVPGIHFYVLNRAKPMEAIAAALKATGHWR